MKMLRPLTLLAVFILVFVATMPAQAYIGPGLGIALVWTLLGPIAALVTAIAIILYFPARYFYKKRRHEKSLKNATNQESDQEKK